MKVSTPVPPATAADLARVARNPVRRVLDGVVDGAGKVFDKVDEHPAAEATLAHSFALFRVLHAFPKFIYPTIKGATEAERSFILQTLDTLPLGDVNSIKHLQVVASLPGKSGLAVPAQLSNVVLLARDQISIRPSWFREVLIHEIGHTKDFESALFGFLGHHHSHDAFGQPPFVTSYARTNAWEDFAESYAKYHVDPESLRASAPEKYSLIERFEQPTAVERLIDRPEFRETGRWLGETLGRYTAVRAALQALYFATGAVQILKGVHELRQSRKDGDAGKHFSGVMDLTAGSLFASKWLAGAGLGVQGAHRAARQALERGEIAPVDADAAVRVLSDRVGRVAGALGQKLGLGDGFQPPPPPPPGSPPPRRARAAAIMAGGAAGALVGGTVGPYLGVIGGHAVAGPVGGAVGLVVGGLAGYALGSSAGGRLGGAVARAVGA